MIRKHHRLTGLALAFVIAALLAPAASARQQANTPSTLPHGVQYSSVEVGKQSTLPHGVGYSSYDVGKPPTPTSGVNVVRVASNPGFDWGDAGIGAAAGFALTMIGLGGLLVLNNRRHRAEQPAPPA
jgi:opacity protein-like surface antigen